MNQILLKSILENHLSNSLNWTKGNCSFELSNDKLNTVEALTENVRKILSEKDFISDNSIGPNSARYTYNFEVLRLDDKAIRIRIYQVYLLNELKADEQEKVDYFHDIDVKIENNKENNLLLNNEINIIDEQIKKLTEQKGEILNKINCNNAQNNILNNNKKIISKIGPLFISEFYDSLITTNLNDLNKVLKNIYGNVELFRTSTNCQYLKLFIKE